MNQGLTPMVPIRRRRQRAQISCTECRRRKQKCEMRKDGPCGNCIRRYPPVECFVKADPQTSSGHSLTSYSSFSTLDTSNKLPPIRAPGGSGTKTGLEQDGARHEEYPLQASFTEGIVPHTQALPQGYDSRQSDENFSESDQPTSNAVFDIESGIQFSRQAPRKNQKRATSPNILLVARRSTPSSGELRGFGGLLASLNTLGSAPIEPNIRNAELLNFCKSIHQFVAPNLVSIDGQNTPALFVKEMLPWMVQSPLMPNIAILMASATQAEHGFEVMKYSETLSIKSKVLALINNFLTQDFSICGGEALRAVIHLAILEWFWGAPAGIWPHMKGLKQMIKLKGGFFALNDPILQQVFILTDYELACCFEKELYLLEHTPEPEHDLPVPLQYSEALRSPLLAYETSFEHDQIYLGLNAATLTILDDVRFLTLSITSRQEDSSTTKVRSTAAWLHARLESFTTPLTSPDTPTELMIHSAILMTAKIYSSSISTLTPTSQLYTPDLLMHLQSCISLVGLAKWKEIPGIFLWILLVACPSASDDHHGRFLRRKMAVTGMTIGMEDFGLAIGQLRAFWKVQRWVTNERTKLKVSV